MASTHKSLRSGTANKRPTTSIAEGQIALNTNAASPGLYFKDSTGASIIKIGPVHVGTTAPNVAPAGSSGNSAGETWLDTSLTPNGWKVWTGAAWTNATPIGSATVQGLLELATDAETQAGSDTARAVTPAGLQSKVSDSTSTTSSTTIASSTAVKSAYDLANAALPKSGGTVTGNLEIGTSGSLTFEGATADAFETTLAVVDPTADRTITLPNATGTVVLDNNGQTVQFGLGAAATPSITFTGDTNTGIYSPGADQVAISTSGSGRLFVDASGNVGLSASSPDGLLTLTGANSNTPRLRIQHPSSDKDAAISSYFDGSGAYLLVGSNHYLNSAGSNAKFDATSGSSAWYLDGSGTGIFYNSSGSGSISERLRITSAGLVGVGTSSPSSVYRTTINGDGSSIVGGLILRNNGTDTLTIGNVAAANDVDSEIWNPRNGYLRFATNNTERLRITAGGLVGIGTSSPSYIIETSQPGSGGVVVGASLAASGNGGAGRGTGLLFKAPGFGSAVEVARIDGRQNSSSATANDATLNFMVADSGGTLQERVTITNAGRVGIGTTSPSQLLTLQQTSAGAAVDCLLLVNASASANTSVGISFATIGGITRSAIIRGINESGGSGNATGLQFLTNANGSDPTEKARIDSSGRLLVGTSSSPTVGDPQYGLVRIQGNTSSASGFGLLSIGRGQAAASISSGSELGHIYFTANDGSPYASISGYSDATGGSNDYPGRLVFSTTADGAASPTERMRITSGGEIVFTKTTTSFNTAGFVFAPAGSADFVRDGGAPIAINRLTNDGELINFYQAGALEGSISVSGTTVSYNGAHLSRWSQLPSGAERTEILRGSVLSNIDEMCEWSNEDNEQLNRMKVSDVEGDKNVSGVFQAWDDDDDTYTDDFYCAMTGDFIIRIAAGTTVERGDLLMSAGDGTAKPQDDDIIRSKTIAKVTSTNVSCTYEDGSYCVPCVLMAC